MNAAARGGVGAQTPPRPADDERGSHLADPRLADAMLAARLLAAAPQQLGGICLRGGGPARDLVIDALRGALPPGTPWRRLPGHIDDDRLCGGIDLAASLVAGLPVAQPGLLAEIAGGVLVVPLSERLRPAVAGRVAQALDGGAPFVLVLLDDGEPGDERPPAALLERIAFDLDLHAVRRLVTDDPPPPAARPVRQATGWLADEGLDALAATAAALGIASLRPLLFAAATARTAAGLDGRPEVSTADLTVAARLVLGPRATQLPPTDDPPEAPDDAPPPLSPEEPSPGEGEASDPGPGPAERLVEAARAAIPPDVLAGIAAGRAARGAQGGGAGRRTASLWRGRPLGARPGLPGGGARLALVDTLRAAIPWQPLRRRDPAPEGAGPIRFRRDDLRVRRFEERSTTLTLFCVDASGSAAMARLGEAKGAVELLLAQAYVQRTEVAVIAFRGAAAEVLLPPTRSLTRAKRALGALPGGGGTPLASGIALARQLGTAAAARGRTPLSVFLTDGSANIAADGTRGRGPALDDALVAARALAADRHAAIVIDISPRPRPEAARLAAAMQARYLPLPFADARVLQSAVALATPAPRAVSRVG